MFVRYLTCDGWFEVASFLVLARLLSGLLHVPEIAVLDLGVWFRLALLKFPSNKVEGVYRACSYAGILPDASPALVISTIISSASAA